VVAVGTRYEFRVAGRLSDRARLAFDEMRVFESSPETIMLGDIVDDSHLHGTLALCRSLGLRVTSLREVPE
jgi:hypothetical protein